MSRLSASVCSNFTDPAVDVRNCSIADTYGVSWDEINSKPVFPYIVAATTPLLVLSTIGNGLILVILWRRLTVRNSVNIIIGNMAFADFFCCFMVSALAIGRNVKHNYVLGEAMCLYDTYVKSWLMNVSDLSLALLCYERLSVLWWPRLRIHSNRKAYIKCATVWFVAAGTYSWEVFHYRRIVERKWADNFVEVNCQHDGDHLWEEIVFYAFLGCLLPDAVVTVCYVLFIREIKRLKANFRSLTGDEAATSEKQHKYEKMVGKMIVVNLIVSWIGWFPALYLFCNPSNDFQDRVIVFLCARFSQQVCSDQWDEWTEMWYLSYHYLVAVRCMVNPLIYGYANKSFRREVRQLIPFLSRSSQETEPLAADR